jgi:hypothetical protein
MTADGLSDVQRWFRALGQRVASSFGGSAPLRHNVTKGRSREAQVVDILRQTLPTRVEVAMDATITSVDGVQAPSFDGVLLDRTMWPRLYHDAAGEVAMVESVVAALEVKSVLNADEIADIFRKSAALRALPRDPRTLHPGPTPVAAFAYTCPNPWLSFFDAVVTFTSSPAAAPSAIAILNVGVMSLLKPVEGVRLSVDQPEVGCEMVFMQTGEDTLLFLVYLLSRWVLLGSPMDQVFRAYSANVFGKLEAMSFDADFLAMVVGDVKHHEVARNCFVGAAADPFAAVYAKARGAIGLA